MEAQITITLTQDEVTLLHTALCDYRGKIGNLAAQIASITGARAILSAVFIMVVLPCHSERSRRESSWRIITQRSSCFC